jgi:phosphoenolpyruvate synthase/pyruvate phosphate dikinase
MYTARFDDATSQDMRLVGGKAPGLALMTPSGQPVAPGFSVSTKAYRQYPEDSGIHSRIVDLLAGFIENLRVAWGWGHRHRRPRGRRPGSLR